MLRDDVMREVNGVQYDTCRYIHDRRFVAAVDASGIDVDDVDTKNVGVDILIEKARLIQNHRDYPGLTVKGGETAEYYKCKASRINKAFKRIYDQAVKDIPAFEGFMLAGETIDTARLELLLDFEERLEQMSGGSFRDEALTNRVAMRLDSCSEGELWRLSVKYDLGSYDPESEEFLELNI